MEKNVCKMTDDSIFLIDIEKILKTKAGKKYKYIPRFVVSYLKHIVHQDELNVFLKDSKNKVGVDFLEACMEFLDAKVEIKGLENLPENGKYTLLAITRWEDRMELLWGIYWENITMVMYAIWSMIC